MKRVYKRMLSLLLAFSMMLSLFPAAAFSEPDAEITAFIPIAIDGGAADSASYADAAAAVAYLNANYASVTAHTYAGGQVSVPVISWEDTDTYDPVAAGSYTFTATLGDIPAGYANPSGLTATAELVVAEKADLEEGVGPGEADGTALLPQNATAVPAGGVTIEDGAYTLPVSLWHAASDQPSMGNNALEQTARLVAEDGQGTLHLTFKAMEFAGLTGYLAQLDLLANIVYNENNYPVDYDLIPATVLSTYDVWDQFNDPETGTDPNCAGKPYPRDLSIPVVLGQEYTWVHVYVPVMGSLGFGDQVARIKLDWSDLIAAEPENAEITLFVPISIEAGSATYADAAAVIAYLNTNYASVTAQVDGGGTVSVPVTGWTDTDNYDPATAGSYTFTAALGDLPAGYANPHNRTATAEVVVKDPGDIADGAYTIPVRLWHSVDDQASMGNNALEQTARLAVEDGEGTLHLTFKAMEFAGLTGYLAQLDLLDNIVFNENNFPVAYDLIPATVISNYDVVDQFNGPDSSDPKCRNKPYPKELSVPVALGQEYTWVHVYVPVMGSMGFGDQVARIKLNWSGLTAVGEPNPEAPPVRQFTDDDGDGVIQLTEDDLAGLSGPTQNVGLSAGGATLNIPAQYLNGLFAGNPGATLQLQVNESPADTRDAIVRLLGSNEQLAAAFDLNLTLGGQSITDLGGRVKITFSLSEAQVTALQQADSRTLRHYAPAAGLTDVNADFDLAARIAAFYTTTLSTYAVVGTRSTGGSDGGGTPNSHGLADGIYSIDVDALMEYADDRSMADQFFIERAQLSVSGETIDVTVVMYGTASSPELATGIKMSYINSLQYKDSSGSWLNAVDSRNEAEDSLKVVMTLSSLDDVYMRVQTEYMGPDYKVFRLVFNKSSIKKGGVSFGKGVDRPITYTITATAGEGGAIDPSGEVSVNKGEDQTFTIKADAGYKIKDVLVKDESVGPVSEYTFTAVESDGTISAVFEKTEEILVEEEEAAQDETARELKFTDIAGHWAEKVIYFVVQRGLFAGASETLFSPDAFITRGMFVTVLGRMSQIDPAKYTALRFADVDPEAYYAPYIAWASAYDIAKGVGDGRFEPDREITREEMAVIFVKYAKFAGIELSDASATANPATPTTPVTPTAPPTAETTTPTAAPPEGALQDGRYTIEASALMENKDDFSMTDQFLTEPATLTVAGGKITAGMVWHGTEYITMDMLEELKIQRSGGELVDVERAFSQEENTLAITFEVEDLEQATIMQVYVPRGMGEMRPKFRLVFDNASLKEQAAADAGLSLRTTGIKLLSYDSAAATAATAPTAAAPEGALQDGLYTIKASALMENKDDFSMADQFLTEPATLTVAGGKITAGMVWHGTEYITMDMLEELKIQRSGGELVDVERAFSQEENTLAITFEVEDLGKATIMQVYVPRGMGEMRPKFRLVFDSASLKEQAAADADLEEQGAATDAGLTAETAVPTAAAPEGALQDGRYTIEASALMENKDDFSMADQFLTEPATLTVVGGKITAGMVWHGTEYITMDMLEELKIQRSGGELVDVERVFNQEENTLTITFEVEALGKATVMQVYVPRGMGEMRPKFRLVFDSASLKGQAATDADLKEQEAATGADLEEQGAATGADLIEQEASTDASLEEPVAAFADAGEISDWAGESVEKMRIAGFIKGKGNNMFDPRGFTTRAEAAVILAKSVGYAG